MILDSAILNKSTRKKHENDMRDLCRTKQSFDGAEPVMWALSRGYQIRDAALVSPVLRLPKLSYRQPWHTTPGKFNS